MLTCPLQNEGVLGVTKVEWLQKRPHITQGFGENEAFYKRYGHKGHNGIDFRAKVGTSCFAPIEGTVKVKNDGDVGYGLHVIITKGNLQVTLAHLSKVLVEDGSYVYNYQKIALTGNTGSSTGPHLHLTVKRLDNGKVLDVSNGFSGAIDSLELIANWKGGFVLNTF